MDPPTDTVPESCTIFTVSFGKTVFFGNNEDYINPNTYYWVSPSTSPLPIILLPFVKLLISSHARWFLLSINQILGAEKSEVLLFPNSGTGIMELSIRNSIPRGEKVLVTVIGAFGERFKEVVESNGRKPVLLEYEPGKAVHPEDIDSALRKNPDVRAVTITHNERPQLVS